MKTSTHGVHSCHCWPMKRALRTGFLKTAAEISTFGLTRLDPLARLAHEVVYLLDAVVVEDVAHVGRAARDRAAVEQVVGLLAAVPLLPSRRAASSGRSTSWPRCAAAPAHAVALAGARLVSEHGVARHVFEAVIAEAVAVGRDVARVADVVVVDAVDAVARDLFEHRQQPLVRVAGSAGRAHPEVRIGAREPELFGRRVPAVRD